MEKLNVHSFYLIGGAIQVNYVNFAGFDQDMIKRVHALGELKKWFEFFVERSEGTTWQRTREKAQIVIQLISRRIDDNNPGTVYVAPFETGYELTINRAIKSFEKAFEIESEGANVFTVTQKGTHATLDLMERAYDNLPLTVIARLDDETKEDLRAAGRCLALDCHTATGYHMLRATERLIVKYVDKVTSNVTLKKKPRDWGAYITTLKAHGGDPKVTGNLQHIKDHYRNPIIHPEDSLNADEAFSLFSTAVSAIIQLDAAIQACP